MYAIYVRKVLKLRSVLIRQGIFSMLQLFFFFFLHTVKWFHLSLTNTNNFIYY